MRAIRQNILVAIANLEEAGVAAAVHLEEAGITRHTALFGDVLCDLILWLGGLEAAQESLGTLQTSLTACFNEEEPGPTVGSADLSLRPGDNTFRLQVDEAFARLCQSFAVVSSTWEDVNADVNSGAKLVDGSIIGCTDAANHGLT